LVKIAIVAGGGKRRGEKSEEKPGGTIKAMAFFRERGIAIFLRVDTIREVNGGAISKKTKKKRKYDVGCSCGRFSNGSGSTTPSFLGIQV